MWRKAACVIGYRAVSVRVIKCGSDSHHCMCFIYCSSIYSWVIISETIKWHVLNGPRTYPISEPVGTGYLPWGKATRLLRYSLPTCADVESLCSFTSMLPLHLHGMTLSCRFGLFKDVFSTTSGAWWGWCEWWSGNNVEGHALSYHSRICLKRMKKTI